MVGQRHRGHRRVRASSRGTTVALRRAPTNADSTTPPPIARSTASTSSAAPPPPGVVGDPRPPRGHAGTAPTASTSSTIRPSRIATVRWAAAAMARVVGDHHDRLAGVVEPAEELQHVGAAVGVEGARRLVGQQHRRRVRHRPGDRQALALTARQARWEGVDLVGEPEQVEQLAGPAPGGPAGGPAEHRRHGDVLGRGHRLEQVEELEHDADRVAPHDRPLVGSERADHVAGDLDDAVVGDLEPGDDRQQRRLAAPRRTGDGDELAAAPRRGRRRAGRGPAPCRRRTCGTRRARARSVRACAPVHPPRHSITRRRHAGRVVTAAADGC